MLKQQFELMDKRYEELSKYFCFDRKKTSMEEFFGDLATFLREFEVNFFVVTTTLKFFELCVVQYS